MAKLTAEELKALEDQLNMEQLLIKKYRSYATRQQTQIKQTCRILQISISSILTSLWGISAAKYLRII